MISAEMAHSVQTGLLMVGNFLSATVGARGVCEDLAEHLTGIGWNVLVTSTKPGRLWRLLDMIATTWGRRRAYELAQVDVFSGLAFFWAEAVCWTLRRAHKPYVLTLHGGNLPAFAQRQPTRVRRLLRSAHVVTTPSRYLLETMCPYRADLRLLPNPLDLSAYEYRAREQPLPRLVWLRAFHEIYNPTLAPKVVAALKPVYPEINLLMIGRDKGDGSFEATKRTAEALSIAERIEMPGGLPKADIPVWLNRGDIFINTTNVDNTPISVLEAMACGICIVSTNVGGIPYLLQHEEDALLVPPNVPEEMARAVSRLLSEPGLATYLTRNARRKVEAFDWRILLPEWHEVLTLARSEVTRGKSLLKTKY
jgi:glycosyltransferase involved in cell wall biosynthesis